MAVNSSLTVFIEGGDTFVRINELTHAVALRSSDGSTAVSLIGTAETIGALAAELHEIAAEMIDDDPLSATGVEQ